jgi:hypothetical protein
MEEIFSGFDSYEEGDRLESLLYKIKKELERQQQEYIRRTYELIEHITSSEELLPTALEDYINVCTKEKQFIDLEYFSRQYQIVGQPSADTALAVHRTAQIATEINSLAYIRRLYQVARDLHEKSMSAIVISDGHISENIRLILYSYLRNLDISQ